MTLINFRDAAIGPMTPGLLYRSASLSLASTHATEKLVDLGVRTAIDLRTDYERETMGSAELPASIDLVPIQILDGAFIKSQQENNERFSLEDIYPRIIGSTSAIGAVFERLAQPDALPAIVFCTAGKDRTGIIIALTQTLAGADRSDVVDDYIATEANMSALMDRLAEIEDSPRKVVARAIAAPPELLRSTLAGLEDTHGSIDGFLHSIDAGVAAQQLASALIG